MKAKDYPAFLTKAKSYETKFYEEAENIRAKVDNVIMKETRRQYLWRNSPEAQMHSWDFYLDEINWA